MLINLRSSVNWLLKAFVCLCGVSVFFLAGSASAQSTTNYYTPSESAGVWVESEWADGEPTPEQVYETEPNYVADGSDRPVYDSATATQQYEQYEQYEQYDASIEVPSESYDADHHSWTEEPAAAKTVVKNRDFFGVNKDACCDEWSRFGRGKDLKYKSNCGGLKANKGHLGIPWLRSADAGEDCDYCQGGCCEKGAAGRERRETRREVFSSARKKCKRDSCDNCAQGNCPEKEGCTSCR